MHVPGYQTIKDLDDFLKLGERTVYDMLRGGRIPDAVKAASHWQMERELLVRMNSRRG